MWMIISTGNLTKFLHGTLLRQNTVTWNTVLCCQTATSTAGGVLDREKEGLPLSHRFLKMQSLPRCAAIAPLLRCPQRLFSFMLRPKSGQAQQWSGCEAGTSGMLLMRFSLADLVLTHDNSDVCRLWGISTSLEVCTDRCLLNHRIWRSNHRNNAHIKTRTVPCVREPTALCELTQADRDCITIAFTLQGIV
jgi:hypothetical protein